MSGKSEFDKRVDYALASGCVSFTPEVAAEVDRLLSKDEPPLTIPQRQRFITAAQRGLAANREERNRARLDEACRCSHRRADHHHDRCGALVTWAAGATTECPCRGFVVLPEAAS